MAEEKRKRILILYYSRTGSTERMARLIGEGVAEAGVADHDVRSVEGFDAGSLLDYDGIIMGSPTYYGTLAYEAKKVIDESVKYHGKLAGKAGSAFTSAANIGGGNETTVLSILSAWLIHGMIVQGNEKGDHYGPVSIGAPDERAAAQCREMGRRFAGLVNKL
ncbi:MAG: flavodoxin family protein [Candidatus Omnitrophica bacterium]|nr:flavodoxin family protein [Candidatus Omnitrophota bacterium]